MYFSWIISLLLCSFAINAKVIDFDKLQLKTGLKAEVVEAEDLKARVLGFTLGLNVEDKLSDSTNFFFDFSISLETGSNESVGNIAEFEPTESTDLNKAGITYKPISLLAFKMGALDQGEHLSPLLVGNTAFAAIEEKILLGPIYIKLQQSIPSNNRLTKRVGSVDDATPFFGMESVGLEYTGKTSFKAEVGKYLYKDLSSSTANISKELGNSVSGLNEAADYNYAFEGMNTVLDFKYTANSGFVSRLSGEYLFNDKAPNGRNTGYIGKLGMGNKVLMFQLETFRNESDTSPSFYNSKYYGHNNMQGEAIELSFKGKDYYFKTKYTKAKLIEENLVQADIELITINLVKLYEI